MLMKKKKKSTDKLTLQAIIPTPSPDCSFREINDNI